MPSRQTRHHLILLLDSDACSSATSRARGGDSKEATLQLLEAFVTHTRQQRWQASKRSEWHIRYQGE